MGCHRLPGFMNFWHLLKSTRVLYILLLKTRVQTREDRKNKTKKQSPTPQIKQKTHKTHQAKILTLKYPGKNELQAQVPVMVSGKKQGHFFAMVYPT